MTNKKYLHETLQLDSIKPKRDMTKRLILYAIILCLCGSFQNMNRENIIVQRIIYLYKLRKETAREKWPAFADKRYDIPLIYYTDSCCYVANPTAKFLRLFEAEQIYTDKTLRIYKTKKRIDNVPFHMEVSISMGTNDTAYYDFKSPFVRCSSYEQALKTVPGSPATDDWAAMIIHEFFHGYQFLHTSTAEYAHKSNATVSALNDSLQSLYNRYSWYKKSIDEENRILLQAIETNVQPDTLIKQFVALRKNRRIETKEKTGISITILENIFEKLEGTARYMEAAVIRSSYKAKTDKVLSRIDEAYRQTQSNADTAWLFQTTVSDTYFYATGYNLTRLLEKINPGFKKKIFQQGDLSLEALLSKEY